MRSGLIGALHTAPGKAGGMQVQLSGRLNWRTSLRSTLDLSMQADGDNQK